MNKLNSGYPTLSYPSAERWDPRPSDRLIVLIPADSDCASAVRRISDLADTCSAHVLLLGLCQEVAQALSLRRELARVSALLQDAMASVETRIEIGSNWTEIVKSNYRTGDLIVCITGGHTGPLQRSLSQILLSDTGMPVYILPDPSSQGPSQSHWLSKVTSWAGFAGILASAFFLQIQITSIPRYWAQTTLLIISVLVEFWLIRLWNELFS